ncbi:MAG: cytidine deaminase [Candidatus Electrothrix sp. AUS1_2]|nr:cytidine deaminase [Candidatus Electrothrix sp. AUS1_2]
MMQTLITKAQALLNPMTLSSPHMSAATVACVLLAANGKIYEGVCIHLSCGLGFCAEAAAVANMIKDGETVIQQIVAVSDDAILSPCGRCREMMVQVSVKNFETEVIISPSFPWYCCEILARIEPSLGRHELS